MDGWIGWISPTSARLQTRETWPEHVIAFEDSDVFFFLTGNDGVTNVL